MITAEVGCALVKTTVNRGFTPEEVAERALDKIMFVGADAPPAIKDQALAYREKIRKVLVFYMKEAIRSDRTTLSVKLTQAGHPELVKFIEGA